MTKATTFTISTLLISTKPASTPIVQINLTYPIDNLYQFLKVKIQRWKVMRKQDFQIPSTYHFQSQSSNIQTFAVFQSNKSIPENNYKQDIKFTNFERWIDALESAQMVNYCRDSDIKTTLFSLEMNEDVRRKKKVPWFKILRKVEVR